MKTPKQKTPKPKAISEMQMNGEITEEQIVKYLEKDINTCLQILYTIREDEELKQVMAKVLKKKFSTKHEN